MATKTEVNKFLKSQQSLQFYKKTQQAFKDVLLALPDKDYKTVTKNLVVVALHEVVLCQMMHFPNPKGKFKVMQLTMPPNVPLHVLRFVIAHELGHAVQGRNWKRSDGKKLETNADEYAAKHGFPRTKSVDVYIKKHWKNPKC